MSTILHRIFPPISEMMMGSSESGSDRRDEKRDPQKKNTMPADSRVMIHGPSRLHNTALLFQCAVSSAMEGQVVMFITHEKISSLPVSIEGAAKPDPLLMKQVHIKYLNDRSSFLKELSQIHIANPAPDIIIVDGLDHYVHNPKSNNILQVTASVCAQLVDAATYLHSKSSKADLSSSSSLHCLMASVTSSSPNTLPSFHEVYGRFFPTTFSITDLEDTSMKQLQCWRTGEELPQYVVTFEVRNAIKVVDVMAGAELDADWSQASSRVT